MKRTLFFSLIIALSLALSGCVVYNPYGPYAFHGVGQQYGKSPDINFNGQYAFSGYAQPGYGCAPMVCEPTCDPCAAPMMQQPAFSYAYGAGCDPCMDPCATPAYAGPYLGYAPLGSWLVRALRGWNYPCNGCGDEIYWGDYGQVPDDECNPCTYEGKWAGNVDRTRNTQYDPCGNCGSCNVCQQGTSFRYPAIGTYMNKLYSPVFQDKIAPTHGTTPLDYGLRDSGSVCCNSCVDPCVNPCIDPCVEPCAAPCSYGCVCEKGKHSGQNLAHNPAANNNHAANNSSANHYAARNVPAGQYPMAQYPAGPAPANQYPAGNSFLMNLFSKRFVGANPNHANYPNHSNYLGYSNQPNYHGSSNHYRSNPAPHQNQAQNASYVAVSHHSQANTTIHNSPPNAPSNSGAHHANHQAQANRQVKAKQSQAHQHAHNANRVNQQKQQTQQNPNRQANPGVYQNAVHYDNGTTLSTAHPVSYTTPQAVPQMQQTATKQHNYQSTERTTYR